MNLHEVVHAGRSGFLYTAFGITGSMIVGLGLGRLMKVGDTSSLLITAGTAICGGSAIAAVRSHREGIRRRDGSFAGNNLRPQFRGTAGFPHDRVGDASHPNPIRVMVGSRDSRHEFSRRRSGQVRNQLPSPSA